MKWDARIRPNETEISCGWRESVRAAGKAFESSQKLIARLPAVSFIDWLDGWPDADGAIPKASLTERRERTIMVKTPRIVPKGMNTH